MNYIKLLISECMHIQYFGTLSDEIEKQEAEYYLQALVLKSWVFDYVDHQRIFEVGLVIWSKGFFKEG